MRAFYVILLATLPSHSAGAAEAQRFSLQGTAALTLDAPMMRNESLRLRAELSPHSTPVVRAVQTGDRFALTAKLAAAAQACYNDTIFRDDFDGDGF